MKQAIFTLSISFALFLGITVPASAYIDPSVGSFVVQSIIASMAAGAAAFGMYWQKIKLLFQGFFNSSANKIENEAEHGADK